MAGDRETGMAVCRAGLTIVLLFAAFAVAAQAQPSELYRCGTLRPPDCGGDGYTFIDPCASFRVYTTRVLWYPLRNVGPITIELETLVASDLPLYVEIVPIPDSLGQSVCASSPPGFVVATAHGIQACGGGWESFGPFDLRSIVPLGGTYGLQLEGFVIFDGDHSFVPPGVGCAVKSAPAPNGSDLVEPGEELLQVTIQKNRARGRLLGVRRGDGGR